MAWRGVAMHACMDSGLKEAYGARESRHNDFARILRRSIAAHTPSQEQNCTCIVRVLRLSSMLMHACMPVRSDANAPEIRRSRWGDTEMEIPVVLVPSIMSGHWLHACSDSTCPLRQTQSSGWPCCYTDTVPESEHTWALCFAFPSHPAADRTRDGHPHQCRLVNSAPNIYYSSVSAGRLHQIIYYFVFIYYNYSRINSYSSYDCDWKVI